MGSSQSRPSSSSPTQRTNIRRRLEPLRRFSTLGRRNKRARHEVITSSRIEGDGASITGLASTGTATTSTVIEETPVISDPPQSNPPVLCPPSNPPLLCADNISLELEPVISIPRSISPSPAPDIHYPVRRPTTPINHPIPIARPPPTRSGVNERAAGLRRTLHIPEWGTSVHVSRRRSWAGLCMSAGRTLTETGDEASMDRDVTGVIPSTPGMSPTTEPSTSPQSSNTMTTTSANTLTSTNPPRPRSPDPTPALHRTRSEPAIGNTLISLPRPSPETQIRRVRTEQTFLGQEVSLLRQQLEASRRELAQAVTDAAEAESNLRNLEDQGGAVMMIQGIAQTHIPISSRRLGRWRRDRERRVPFEEQASTIIGLILVASLATANTLLSTERPRPRPNTILETLMRRIQPSRAFAVETLLADPSISSSSQTRSRRRRSTGSTGDPESTANLNMPAEFTDWLNNLQASIREAMREFVDGSALPISRTTSAQHTDIERPGAGRRVSAPVATLNDLILDSNIGDEVPQGPSTSRDEIPHPPGISSLEVPQFHHQPGQTTSSTTQNRTGVTTDLNGIRSLSFFRAHLFATPDNGPNTMVPCLFVGVRSTNQDPATFGEGGHPFSDPPRQAPPRGGAEPEIIPEPHSRRSMAGFNNEPTRASGISSPGTNTNSTDTVSPIGPNGELLPNVYRSRVGRVPMSSPNGGPDSAPLIGQAPRVTYDRNRLSRAPSSPNGGAESGLAVSRTQALRSRLLALSPFSRHHPSSISQESERERDTSADLEIVTLPEPGPEPEATFIMYVIGGNFPRNHPVLRIPGLITGEPLSDEEMVLMGELMGEVKPPTATAEEVASSGLRVIRGNEIRGLVERKEVIDSSADRCLVCLSDFEDEEECRILNCRHVFHMECVDQWIKVGRNACPACRTEAVDRKPKTGSTETATTTNQTIRQEADVPTEV